MPSEIEGAAPEAEGSRAESTQSERREEKAEEVQAIPDLEVPAPRVEAPVKPLVIELAGPMPAAPQARPVPSPPSSRERADDLLDGFRAFSVGGMRPIAILALITTVFARAIAPSLRGIALGWDVWIDRGAFVATVLSLSLLFFLVCMLVAQLVTFLQSRTNLVVRLIAILLGGMSGIIGVFAPVMPHEPFFMLLVSGGCAATIALVLGASILQKPESRGVGLALILTGLGTATRALASFAAEREASRPRADGILLSRVAATSAFATCAVVVLVALGWIATRKRVSAIPVLVVAAGLVGYATWSFHSNPDSTTTGAFLVRAGVRLLLPRPVPLVPLEAEFALALAGPALGLAALTIPSEVRPRVAALAMVLVVGVSAEIPVLSLMLVVASLSAAVVAHDPRTIWTAISKPGY